MACSPILSRRLAIDSVAIPLPMACSPTFRCVLQCTIRLQLIDGALHLSVEDNGSGLPEVVHRGVGLASMRERAEEVGGTFGIAGRPGGGTNVKVSLPLLEVEPVT